MSGVHAARADGQCHVQRRFQATFAIGEFEENRDSIQKKYGPYSSLRMKMIC